MSTTVRANDLLRESGVEKEGHYEFASKRCGHVIIDMWELYSEATNAFEICGMLADMIIAYCAETGQELPDFICGPARGAIWIAQLTAIQITLKTGHACRAFFVEKDPDRPGQKYAFRMPLDWVGKTTGKRGVVVEDVTTTGESSAVARDCFDADGADIFYAIVIRSRSKKVTAESVRAPAFKALTTVEMPDFHPSVCTKCIAGIPHDNA